MPHRAAQTTATVLGTTLLKGLAVLEALAASDDPRGVTDLAKELGLVKSDVHRLLQALADQRYVRKVAESGRYECTLKVWELGALVAERLDLRRVARHHVEDLAHRTSETVHLSVLDGAEVLYVDKIDSPQPVRAYSRIGGRAPASCVATGKALLAHAPEAVLNRVVETLKRYTPRTITNGDALRKELRRVRDVGYAVNRGEWRETVCGLAAPIFDVRGEAIAAIGISGPIERLTSSRLRELVPLVVFAARAISRALGFSGGAAARAA